MLKFLKEKLLKKRILSVMAQKDEFTLINQEQFQALQYNRVPMLLIDLRKETAEPVIARAQKISSNKVHDFLQEQNAMEFSPIVLICETSQISKKVAAKLSDKYLNVTVLEGGVNALPK